MAMRRAIFFAACVVDAAFALVFAGIAAGTAFGMVWDASTRTLGFAFAAVIYFGMSLWFVHNVRSRRCPYDVVSRCTACGYDLRATPARCSECGTAVRPAESPERSQATKMPPCDDT